MESGMSQNRNSSRGGSSLDWRGANHAAPDAWDRWTDSIERAPRKATLTAEMTEGMELVP
jgi:hypothetical protein